MDSGVSSSGELDLAAWQGVVDQFAKLGGTSITYSGGEPLLFPQFHALAAHGQEQGLRTDLITNGMLIRSRADAAAVAAVVDMVRISVDGATAEGHERIRGKGTFPRVNRALEMLAEEDVRLEVAVTLFPNNVEDVVTNVESYLTSLLERGVRPAKVAFSRGMEEGRATGSLDVLDFEVIYRDIKRRLDGELWDLEHPRPPLKFADCGYGDSLTLSATGEVYPCGLLYRSGGNVRREPLGVIYDRFRKEQKQLTVDRLPVCRECDVRYICGGGCRLRNLKVNGNLGRTACSAAWREEYYRLLMGRDEVFLRLGQRALEQRSIDRMEKSRNEQRKELRNDREAAA
jgi:radical SAM protein with 4Fe4S-binding SPASM domain